MGIEVPPNVLMLSNCSMDCMSFPDLRWSHANIYPRSVACCTWGAEGASMVMRINEDVNSVSCPAYAIGSSSVVE
jgi:hypothetical protein